MQVFKFIVAFAIFHGVLAGHQTPFIPGRYSAGYNDLAGPVGLGLSPDASFDVKTMHLSSLQATESFTTLSHPRFPDHQVRVKKSDFCDPTVK